MNRGQFLMLCKNNGDGSKACAAYQSANTEMIAGHPFHEPCLWEAQLSFGPPRLLVCACKEVVDREMHDRVVSEAKRRADLAGGI